MVDRYPRLTGDKTIPVSAEPHLESFYPPFVAGIDVVDRYLRLMGDKTIPDSAEPRLESFYPHSSKVSIYQIKV